MSRRWALLALAFFFAPATFVGPLRHYVAAPRRAVGVAAKTVFLGMVKWQDGNSSDIYDVDAVDDLFVFLKMFLKHICIYSLYIHVKNAFPSGIGVLWLQLPLFCSTSWFLYTSLGVLWKQNRTKENTNNTPSVFWFKPRVPEDVRDGKTKGTSFSKIPTGLNSVGVIDFDPISHDDVFFWIGSGH